MSLYRWAKRSRITIPLCHLTNNIWFRIESHNFRIARLLALDLPRFNS